MSQGPAMSVFLPGDLIQGPGVNQQDLLKIVVSVSETEISWYFPYCEKCGIKYTPKEAFENYKFVCKTYQQPLRPGWYRVLVARRPRGWEMFKVVVQGDVMMCRNLTFESSMWQPISRFNVWVGPIMDPADIQEII